MPSARVDELRRVALKLGFVKARTKGSHERWIHSDGRSTTIPIHGNRNIHGGILHEILDQLGISLSTFRRLK